MAGKVNEDQKDVPSGEINGGIDGFWMTFYIPKVQETQPYQ